MVSPGDRTDGELCSRAIWRLRRVQSERHKENRHNKTGMGDAHEFCLL